MHPTNVVAAAGQFALFSDMVAGTDGSFVGFNVDTFGSMSNRFLGGQTIEVISHNLTTFPVAMLLLGENIPDTDATFISLNITGVFTGGINPRTEAFLRSTAVYTPVFFGDTQWQFTPASQDRTFVNGNTYDVEWRLDMFLLAESVGSLNGYAAGFVGLLAPDTFNGFTIDLLAHSTTVDEISYRLLGDSIPNDNNAFESMRLKGTFSSGEQDRTYLRTDAVYTSPTPASTTWTWSGVTEEFLGGNTYDVIMT